MKQLILLLAVVAALLAGLGYWVFWRGNPESHELSARAVATRGLAEYLAKTQAGHRAMVLSNPYSKRAGAPRDIVATEQAGIRGLRQGFGTGLTLEAVAFPELKAAAQTDPRAVYIDPETTTPLSYLVAEDAFDNLARQYADCDVVVSLIGLPAKLTRVQCWQTNGPPKFALLLPDLRIIGDREAVKRAVKSGKLAAFVLSKPDAPDSNTPVGRDFAAEFEKRFVLVTAENIDQVTRAYPKLF